jgi:argininosuccinate synthase
VGRAVTGTVTIELRRGEDWSLLDTEGPHLSYHPERLSMEKVRDETFSATDRIGQLQLRTLDIMDSAAMLDVYAESRASNALPEAVRRLLD